ncbi:TetR/AcrR family transcriptional regulator [Streptomyces iakyrus]|uniref:TetR/AcrR family transcriptional regulator n=1 Tax=Streptomyces iakyrus TaxID=68219 RepID=UPI00068F8F96|nr:helix-turn-helix domain-containing protein [Streptomyces iakyrus]
MTSDPGLRQRKKMRTRQALIEGALRLFAEKGYEQTTVAEIAASADIATRTFFSYFDSKDDIVFFDDRSRLERAVETSPHAKSGATGRSRPTKPFKGPPTSRSTASTRSPARLSVFSARALGRGTDSGERSLAGF